MNADLFGPLIEIVMHRHKLLLGDDAIELNDDDITSLHIEAADGEVDNVLVGHGCPPTD